MNKTKIPYLDYTCNPISGCSGEGCAVRKNCWALSMAKRLAGRHGYPKDEPFTPTFHEDKLDEPFKVKKPSLVGLCFMGDFYDKLVQRSWQTRVQAVVALADWHTYLILTKQPQNIPTWEWATWPKNLWIGVSVNRKADLWRIDELKKRANPIVRFVSFEPLYEKLDVDLTDIDWIIIGAQTRPNIQPKPEWVAGLIQYARIFGAKIFLKNNLFPQPTPTLIQEFPERR